MILITGGAYQGKRKFAGERFGISEEKMLDGGVCGFDEVFSAECVYGYHKLIKRLMAQGEDPVGYTERLCRENSGMILILDEVGCGIIPLDKGERQWREQTGRCGCTAAGHSVQVWRVTCGIAQIIKGEEI